MEFSRRLSLALSQLSSDHNPYAAPQAHVADAPLPPRVKPRTVLLATAALWLAYGASFAASAIDFRHRLTLLSPMQIVVLIVGELCFAALIYFVSIGRSWARLIYAVGLAVRTAGFLLIPFYRRHPADPVTLMWTFSSCARTLPCTGYSRTLGAAGSCVSSPMKLHARHCERARHGSGSGPAAHPAP